MQLMCQKLFNTSKSEEAKVQTVPKNHICITIHFKTTHGSEDISLDPDVGIHANF